MPRAVPGIHPLYQNYLQNFRNGNRIRQSGWRKKNASLVHVRIPKKTIQKQHKLTRTIDSRGGRWAPLAPKISVTIARRAIPDMAFRWLMQPSPALT